MQSVVWTIIILALNDSGDYGKVQYLHETNNNKETYLLILS